VPHIVAMAGITIGKGSMAGEYTSIRDANHVRADSTSSRDAGHSARPISIGSEVRIGRGVAVLSGATIGDKATVGATAVVTRDVPAGTVAVGIPAGTIRSKSESGQFC
jgi:acetyltransferase-like isoleucine patch superfamily enzyme